MSRAEHGRGQASVTDLRVRFMVIGSSSLRGQRAGEKSLAAGRPCSARRLRLVPRQFRFATKVFFEPKLTDAALCANVC